MRLFIATLVVSSVVFWLWFKAVPKILVALRLMYHIVRLWYFQYRLRRVDNLMSRQRAELLQQVRELQGVKSEMKRRNRRIAKLQGFMQTDSYKPSHYPAK